MNILMMTNTFTPVVGGLERSIETFSSEFRKRGHRVLVVAPEFENLPAREEGVARVPAIRQVNGSEFSLYVPVPGALDKVVKRFRPDLVHSHHPYLIGDAAFRVAYTRQIPLVFTHHTLYEQYTHYIPGRMSSSDAMKRFMIALSTGYANLADMVFCPSESVARLIKRRGVKTPLEVVPTGINLRRFAKGNGGAARREFGFDKDSFLVGHLGRLAPEKNLSFLALAVASFLKRNPRAGFVVIGKGPLESDLKSLFERAGVARRVHFSGVLRGQKLVDAYHALDVFAFTSHSETQGLVLVEAMAAGVPVVAVDAPGVREVVKDFGNGRLFFSDSISGFAGALQWMTELTPVQRRSLRETALKTARTFSMPRCAEKALWAYEEALQLGGSPRKISSLNALERTKRSLIAEWNLMKHFTKATGAMVKGASN